jgi:hypothetical protein
MHRMATMSEKKKAALVFGHGIVIDPLSAAFLVGPELRNFGPAWSCLVTEHDITRYVLTTTPQHLFKFLCLLSTSCRSARHQHRSCPSSGPGKPPKPSLH